MNTKVEGIIGSTSNFKFTALELPVSPENKQKINNLSSVYQSIQVIKYFDNSKEVKITHQINPSHCIQIYTSYYLIILFIESNYNYSIRFRDADNFLIEKIENRPYIHEIETDPIKAKKTEDNIIRIFAELGEAYKNLEKSFELTFELIEKRVNLELSNKNKLVSKLSNMLENQEKDYVRQSDQFLKETTMYA